MFSMNPARSGALTGSAAGTEGARIAPATATACFTHPKTYLEAAVLSFSLWLPDRIGL